jgi:hypothetical protein
MPAARLALSIAAASAVAISLLLLALAIPADAASPDAAAVGPSPAAESTAAAPVVPVPPVSIPAEPVEAPEPAEPESASPAASASSPVPSSAEEVVAAAAAAVPSDPAAVPSDPTQLEAPVRVPDRVIPSIPSAAEQAGRTIDQVTETAARTAAKTTPNDLPIQGALSPVDRVLSPAHDTLRAASQTVGHSSHALLTPLTPSSIASLLQSPPASAPPSPRVGVALLESLGMQHLAEFGGIEPLRSAAPSPLANSAAGLMPRPPVPPAATGVSPGGASERPGDLAPLDGNYPMPSPGTPDGAVSGLGGSSFVPIVALLALLALAASAILRRLGEGPAFRAPSPFVCALERPG